MKVCPSCKQEKDENQFYRKKNGRLYTYCNMCKNDISRIYHHTHKHQYFVKKDNWRKVHTTKICTNCKQEKPLSQFQKTVNASGGLSPRCRLCVKEISKQYYQHNKEKILFRTKEYEHKKYNLSPEYALKRKLRSRFYAALRNQHVNKRESILNILGCDISTLKLYIESKFKHGMSWSNFGLWHIDHIIPCAKFNLTEIEEQKRCFNYTNLQPLWAEENQTKHCKYEAI